ncbi:MAG: replicative DNA helicase [Dehalococcoidia bacterium]
MTRVINPHDLDAERAVLGGLLIRPDGLDEVDGVLRSADFFRHAHACIYDAIVAVRAKGEPIDLLLVQHELGVERLAAAGGPAYLASLVDGVPRSTNVAYYAGIVRALATRRAFLCLIRDVEAQAEADEESTDDIRDRTIAALAELGRLDDGGGFVTMSTLTDALLARLQESTPQRIGVPTGFSDLDALLGGLKPANLIYLAARPSVGKTAFALDMALAMSRAGRTVGVVSIEMSCEELMMRIAAQAASVDSYRLQHSRLSSRDYGRVGQVVNELAVLPLAIDDSSAVTIADVRSRARRWKAQHGLDCLMIDYLQLIRPARAGRGERVAGTRTEELGAISHALKALAKELHVPVLCLSQLSRECERRADHRPVLSDLRDSGDLEQDADVVLFLHRESMFGGQPTPHGQPDQAECLVAKNRNGPRGSVSLTFVPEYVSFKSTAHNQADLVVAGK